ncbi:L-Aspartase-like protein [Violaceomyces palustris]|uniref:L-Aspartase-like protein n=1 Tax=Violaceomyces palustris TaxID=1673888 RepID=A0ACD0P820_9BASI|nr:L-Aspartase-like protein [Violaceomyces palustris]
MRLSLDRSVASGSRRDHHTPNSQMKKATEQHPTDKKEEEEEEEESAFPSSPTPWLDRARPTWKSRHHDEDSQSPPPNVTLDGSNLDLEKFMTIVAYCRTPTLDPERRSAMQDSVSQLQGQRSNRNMIYGINIPFGAGAYTTLKDDQTEEQETIDRALITLINGDLGGRVLQEVETSCLGTCSPLSAFGDDDSRRLTMPTSWVRGAMVLRINSLLRASSGCRWQVCERLISLLDHQLYPVIPIRNSISASGDLSPLSYIAYAMCGSDKVQIYDAKNRRTMKADQALSEAGLEPLFSMEPREMLATINGTGACLSLAALALDRLDGLSLATHVITSIMCEALVAACPSFLDPYLHDVARPHPGQCESAEILRRLLQVGEGEAGSQLLRHHDEDPLEFLWDLSVRKVLDRRVAEKEEGARLTSAPKSVGQSAAASHLRQDRYHLRCAPQYVGPALEELASAHDILRIEFNSVTDNPLLKPSSSKDGRGRRRSTVMVHGGNFMACSVGQATEKMRDVSTSLGRLIHEQLIGSIDPIKNNSLPAYLCAYGADRPAMTGGLRSLDIASSSYLAELTFLSQRLIHLNRNAECGNQSLNSMALASARYTLESVDLLTTMAATSLLAACQALELRLLTVEFFRSVTEKVLDLLEEPDPPLLLLLPTKVKVDLLFRIFSTWNANWPVSVEERTNKTIEATLPPLVMGLITSSSTTSTTRAWIEKLDLGLRTILLNQWGETMRSYRSEDPPSIRISGSTSKVLRFVRVQLGIPLDAGGGLQAMHSTHPSHSLATYGHSVTLLANAFRNRTIDRLWHELI